MNVKKFSSNPSLSIVLLGIIIITSLFTLLLFLTNILEFNNVWAATGGTAIPTYMISTRDGSDPPKGVQEIGYRNIPANKNVHEYDGAIDVVVQNWLRPPK